MNTNASECVAAGVLCAKYTSKATRNFHSLLIHFSQVDLYRSPFFAF